MADAKISQLTEQTAPVGGTTFVPVVATDLTNRKVSLQNVVKAGITAGGVGLSTVATSGSYADLTGVPATPAISNLSDVDVSNIANGTVLRYSTTVSKWQAFPETDLSVDGGNF